MSKKRSTVYLDLETTGVKQNDEIVQIAIVDDDGNVLVNTTVKPSVKTEWPEAEEVHGISPIDVKDSPLMGDIRQQVLIALGNKRVVIYNADFDSKFLKREFVVVAEVRCAMQAFCTVSGISKWQKLEDAARIAGYEWDGDAHDALADALACRAVWHYCLKQSEKNKEKSK